MASIDRRGANLRGADLRGEDLRGIDFCGADLSWADLRDADLRETDLRDAVLREAVLIGADLRETNLRGANLFGANLREVDLRAVNLREVNLGEADLREARLRDADLRGVDLRKVRLGGADLREAGLREAVLRGVDLREVNLSAANLRYADLRGANLSEADLGGARLSGADLGGATLSGADLRGASLEGIELTESMLEAKHLDDATVDWRTVAKSLRLGDRLLPLLLRTGMPDVVAIYLIDSVRSIDATDLFTMLQSVFLSYGRPDEAFAARLRNELTENGVKTWFFPKDAEPGARLHRHLQKQINTYDRLILCCSEASLQRKGVLHEVEEVLEREATEGGSEVMIPILLSDIFENGASPPAWWPAGKEHVYLALQRRVAADFRDAMTDPDVWGEQLARLLKALRKRPATGS